MSCNGMRKIPDDEVPPVNEEVPDAGVGPLAENSADSGFLAWQNAASDGSFTNLEEIATGNGDPAVEIENGGKREMPPLPDGYFELEAIRKKRVKKGRAEYLIKWIGYPESDNTWEPYEHLEGCADVVEAFEQGLQSGKGESGKKHKPWKKRRTPRIMVAEEPTIVKIIRLVSTQVSDDPNAEVLLKFAVIRSDGKESTADNKYMKLHCPQLLFSYYERCMACTYEKETAEKEDANNKASAS